MSPSARIERAELPVQTNSTFQVFPVMALSSAARRLLDGNADRLAARRRCGAARRSVAGRLRGFAEDGNAVEGMEMLPGDALRIGHPMLFAARIAARRLAFVEERHVGG